MEVSPAVQSGLADFGGSDLPLSTYPPLPLAYVDCIYWRRLSISAALPEVVTLDPVCALFFFGERALGGF